MSQELFGVNQERLVGSLARMEADMALLKDMYVKSPAELREELDGADDEDFHNTMDWLGERSTGIVEDSPVQGAQPKTKYGKALLAASHVEGVSSYHYDGLCLEMEPRLMRSLKFHTPDNIRSTGWAGKASLVILGEDDRPVGYQKSSGVKSTYVWDQATLQTSKGKQTVPADSFAYLRYNEAIKGQWHDSTAGLIALRAHVDTVEVFGISRLSARCYPPTVRLAMANAASERQPKLKANIQAATTFKPQDVHQRVLELMASGLVPIIG